MPATSALVPFGEYRPDVSDYLSPFSRTVTNVVPRGDGYGPFRGFAPFTSALPAACRGFFYARKADGSIAVFAGTATGLYRLDNSALGWIDVSKGGAAYIGLPAADHWQFAQFGSVVVAVQANTVPQAFNLDSSSAFADLGGTPPAARAVGVVGRFLVLTGLINNPFRIHWSGLNAITTWTPGVSSCDFQDLPDGGIVRGVAGGEFGVILQETVIRRMTYAPGSPVIFQIERLAEDKGLLAPYSLIKAGDRIFFLAAQGFQGMVATGAPQAIGKERVDRTFFETYDSGSLQLIIGAADPQETRVYWAYKSQSGETGRFDRILCYDYALDRWSTIEATGEYLASLARPGLTLENLDTVSPSLDALTFSLDEVSTAALSKLAAVNGEHKLGFYAGDTLEATIETGAQALGPRRVRVRGLRPITDAATCLAAVARRETLQAPAASSPETGVNATGLCPANVSTRIAVGRLRIPAGESWSFARGLEPETTPEGKR